jgi:hypothetical protein
VFSDWLISAFDEGKEFHRTPRRRIAAQTETGMMAV